MQILRPHAAPFHERRISSAEKSVTVQTQNYTQTDTSVLDTDLQSIAIMAK